MKYAMRAALVGATMLAAPSAWAETTWTVAKVIITGSKSVPADKLMAVVQEHAGSKVTKDDIIADRDAISKVLEAAHVVGAVQPSMKADGRRIDVTFDIEDKGIQAPVVTHVAPKLDAEIFQGNKAIPTDKLMAASGLTVGEDLSNEKIAAAEAAIAAAYKAAKLPVSMGISGENRMVAPGKVDVIWTITETKAKKKRNTDDDGGEKMDQ